MQPVTERHRDEAGEEAATGERGLLRRREMAQDLRADQMLHRVVPQEGRKERGDGWEVGDAGRLTVRDPVRDEAVIQAGRKRRGQSGDEQGEEDPDRKDLRRVHGGRGHARAGTAMFGRQAAHDRRPVRRSEHGHGQTGEQEDGAEDPVGEVDRQQLEEAEAEGGADHAAGGEGSRAVAVRKVARERSGDQEAGGEREHGQPGPQGRLGEVVAVEGQPDPLQPDDEHEHEAAPGHGGQEAGQNARR